MPAVFTPAAGTAWIERQWGRRRDGEGVSLAITVDGVAVGLVVLLGGDAGATYRTGYWLVPGARGRGIAPRAARMIAAWGLGRSGVERVEALVAVGNTASVRTLEKAGFAREGVLPGHLHTFGHPEDALVFTRTS